MSTNNSSVSIKKWLKKKILSLAPGASSIKEALHQLDPERFLNALYTQSIDCVCAFEEIVIETGDEELRYAYLGA